MTHFRYENLLIFCSVAVAVWYLVIYFWPRIFLNVYKRALLTKGFEGPISINTLATEPQAIFADPLHRARLCHKAGNDWREPRHVAYRRRVKSEGWTAGPACTRHGGTLLQRAVHGSEQHCFCLRRQAHHRYASGRLSDHGPRLEGTGAERHDPDFV